MRGWAAAVKEVRIWVVGLGTVGQWVLRALHTQTSRLAGRYGFVPKVVGAAARDGFAHDPSGLDLRAVIELISSERSISELPNVRHWPTAIEGLDATEADVLVEVTASGLGDGGEPGVTHMRSALRRAIPVVTSNKWPVALHGVELVRMARQRGTTLRAESTVMSGTPVLSSLVNGLAGTRPTGLRGVVNATANDILTRMEAGRSYEDALAAAQDAGLAERDPTADVEGYDAMAKAMVLAGLVFGVQLRPEDVAREGIAGIDAAQVQAARSRGMHLKEVVTLELSGERLTARVAPTPLPGEDPLARVVGASNAVCCRAEPVGEVTIIGPGAGPELAGQGVLSDLIAVAASAARC
jgi:homoserine dehydrogenase